VDLVVRSGGQTGVDRAALDAAIACGVPYTGWCPRGGLAEDIVSPPGLVARYPRLRETPSEDTSQRTEWNVRDSDATLLLIRGALIVSPGTAFTKRCAEEIYRKPWRLVDLDVEPRPAGAREWLAQVASAAPATFVLNVAGPREPQSPGIHGAAYVFMVTLLADQSHPVPRLWRSRTNRVFAGVLGGLAERFGWEPRPLRILYSMLTIVTAGALAIPYVALWAITRLRGPARATPRLWRSESRQMVGGVLGGLAEKLGVGATAMRVLFSLATIFTGVIPGVLTYLILWAVVQPVDVEKQ